MQHNVATLDQEIRRLSGELYQETTKEIAIAADNKQKAAGNQARAKQQEAAEDSGTDFLVDLASPANAGVQIAKIGLEVFDDRRSDPGASAHGETMESIAKPHMHSEKFVTSEAGDLGTGLNRIQTEGDYPITYATSNIGESLNSDFQGVASTEAAIVESMDSTIQLSRALDLRVQQELGYAQQAKKELGAEQAQTAGFAPGGMMLSKASGPKGYTEKPRNDDDSTNSTSNWG